MPYLLLILMPSSSAPYYFFFRALCLLPTVVLATSHIVLPGPLSQIISASLAPILQIEVAPFAILPTNSALISNHPLRVCSIGGKLLRNLQLFSFLECFNFVITLLAKQRVLDPDSKKSRCFEGPTKKNEQLRRRQQLCHLSHRRLLRFHAQIFHHFLQTRESGEALLISQGRTGRSMIGCRMLDDYN